MEDHIELQPQRILRIPRDQITYTNRGRSDRAATTEHTKNSKRSDNLVEDQIRKPTLTVEDQIELQPQSILRISRDQITYTNRGRLIELQPQSILRIPRDQITYTNRGRSDRAATTEHTKNSKRSNNLH